MRNFGQKEEGHELRHIEASTAIQGASKNVPDANCNLILRKSLLFQYQILCRE